MINNDLCSCNSTVRKSWGTTENTNGQIICGFCDLLTSEQVEVKGSPTEATPLEIFTRKAKEIDHVAVGLEAANRTERYATLFEKIGSVVQSLNTIGACLLLVVGFFLTGAFWVKVIYWIAILILWGFSYVQTAFIRGLASYFQMKASDHIIRYKDLK